MGHAHLRDSVADPLKHVTSHLCYHRKFGRSMSNRLGVDRGSQKLRGTLGPRPIEMWTWLTPRNMRLHLCYHAKFGHSGNLGQTVGLYERTTLNTQIQSDS